MADKKKTPRARSKSALLSQLGEVRALDRSLVAQADKAPQAQLLALWQARRLAATYRDFHKQRRYAQAVEFFLQDLYGPRDFAQRDADLEKLFPLMSRLLPAAALDALRRALELHALTQVLDAAMLGILCRDLKMRDSLTPAMWAEAYRRTGREQDRARQIALTAQAGRQLDVVVMRPMVYTLVVLARGPAKAAGFGELQDFVERGFKAFRGMQGAAAFIDAVETRESRLMQSLFAGDFPVSWQQEPGTLVLGDLPGGEPRTAG